MDFMYSLFNEFRQKDITKKHFCNFIGHFYLDSPNDWAECICYITFEVKSYAHTPLDIWYFNQLELLF